MTHAEHNTSIAGRVADFNANNCGNMAALQAWKDPFTVSIYSSTHEKVDRRYHCRDMDHVREIICQKRKDKVTGRTILTGAYISDAFTVANNGLRAIILKHNMRR